MSRFRLFAIGALVALFSVVDYGCKGSDKSVDMNGSDGVDMAAVNDGAVQGDDLSSSADGGADMATRPKTLSFAAASTLTTTLASVGRILAGDFNHDGNTDLMVESASPVVSNSGAALDPLLSNGDGTFVYDATKALPATRSSPFSVGDFNQDLKDDVAYFYSTCVTDPKTHVTTCTPHLVVATSNGDGTFATGGPPAPTYMGSLAAQDLNGDHVVDFVSVSADAMNNPNGFTVYLNNGANPLTKTDYLSPTYPAQTSPPIVIDLNADGAADVFYGSAGALIIVNGAANGTFAATPTMIATPNNVGTTSLAVGDINGDLRPDLIVGHDNMTFSVYVSKVGGGYATPNDYPAVASPTSLATGDFNGDGMLDIITCDTSNLRVFVNQGNGFKQPFTIAQSCQTIAVGDFNHDGLADVATNDGSAGYVLMNTAH